MKTKKWICALLAICMLVPLLSCMAVPAAAQTYLDRIDAIVTEPVAGAPFESYITIEGETFIADAQWVDVTAAEYPHWSDTFELGHIYELRANFDAKPGYSMGWDTVITINGKETWEWHIADDGMVATSFLAAKPGVELYEVANQNGVAFGYYPAGVEVNIWYFAANGLYDNVEYWYSDDVSISNADNENASFIMPNHPVVLVGACAETEANAGDIDTIDLTTVEPTEGVLLSNCAATAAADAPYEVVNTDWYFWGKADGMYDWQPATGSYATYSAERVYRCRVNLKAKVGYQFTNETQVQCDCDSFVEYGTTANLSLYYPRGGDTIKTAEIHVDGAVPEADMENIVVTVPDDARYFVSSATFVHDDIDSMTQLSAGGVYELQITLKGKTVADLFNWKPQITLSGLEHAYITINSLGYQIQNLPQEVELSVVFYVDKCDGGSACPGHGFTDMPAAANWAHEGIDYAITNGLMNGISDTEFKPNGTLTRAQLVMILYRMADSPATEYSGRFSDVPGNAWFMNAVEWAADNSIVNGYEDGTFLPNKPITREQIATILYRFNNEPAADGSATAAYPDAAQVSAYAKPAVDWAVRQGLINGVSVNGVSYLRPQDTATRAQIAAIMMRYLNES